MQHNQISPERQGLHYIGLVLAVIGFVFFGSVFVTGAMHFGNPSSVSDSSEPIRAVLGMGLMILGGVLAILGRMGAAGSGVILDPQKARKDIEPWSRMTGGVFKDALDEAGISLGNAKDMHGLPFDEQLRRLHKLREDGIISEQEYDAKKKQILESA